MIARTINTGKVVANPNTAGKMKPYGAVTTMGIRDTKKRTNMVGQKAIEKLTPIKKEPSFPFCNRSGILLVSRLIRLSLKTPSTTRPTKMITGPMIFLRKGKYVIMLCSNVWPINQTNRPNMLNTKIFPNINDRTSDQSVLFCIVLFP